MLETIEFQGDRYPLFQTLGNASKFAVPYAKYFCRGKGVDVGFGKGEWKLPGAIGADVNDKSNEFEAWILPGELDYVYSSHCLEHIPNWVGTIEYWANQIKSNGILFLYLPHPDQRYWKPWNNRNHLHSLYPDDVKGCMEKFGFHDILVSERDLNHSFMIVGEKK